MSARSLPARLENSCGLAFEINANASVRRIMDGDVMLSSLIGNELEGGGVNVYLRRHGDRIDAQPLLGPASPARFAAEPSTVTGSGEWQSLRFRIELRPAAALPLWFWHVEVANEGDTEVTVDLVHTQDLALAHYGAIRNNEFYVSQYIDFEPLRHSERGALLAARQNLAMGGRHPWALIGSLRRAVGFATDALQFAGLGLRAGGAAAALSQPSLPSQRLQHEHAMAVLQDEVVTLAPGAVMQGGFFCWYDRDHRNITQQSDAGIADLVLLQPEARPSPAQPVDGEPPAPSLFTSRPVLAAIDLQEKDLDRLFGTERRHTEHDDGQLLSFFHGDNRHVVLRAKELQVLRPHGHIIRTGDSWTPDEASMTSNLWMNGVFHSLVTQGHVNINRLLSNPHSYLSLLRAAGLRVFVEFDDGYRLLDVPSAFEISPNACRWIYAFAGGEIHVRSAAAVSQHQLELQLEVVDGPARRLLLFHHVAINGDDGATEGPVSHERNGHEITIRPAPDSDVGRRFPSGSFRLALDAAAEIEQVGGDELIFADGVSRRQPCLVIRLAPTKSLRMQVSGQLIPASSSGAGRNVDPSARDDLSSESSAETQLWNRLLGGIDWRLPPPGRPIAPVARLREILPWFAHNAIIHYLAPRGLEQYSGGGWGTRDVCQGPVELLLGLGHWQPVRTVLELVFRQQNPDGDWPQWFMFFERERNIRPQDSHGDIVFWPLLALAEYLLASNDAAFLEHPLPYFDPEGEDRAERATVWEHVERALALIDKRVIPHTNLAAYGHGDWNDSLQPVDPAMTECLCSSWTVTLHYQTFRTLADALERGGRLDLRQSLVRKMESIRNDFGRLLIHAGTVAGFVYFHKTRDTELLLHPDDAETGIHYSLLPMSYGILSELFTPEQAREHVAQMKRHLLAPDGARLFDRPFAYRGGLQMRFQRAESSSFFGREIGIMYMHANLRFAEAMAHYGDAEAFFQALQYADPIGVESVIPGAARRQSNCYYSSSDAAFTDRYQALAEYDRVRTGAVPFEGGWRIYSSGAGIAVRLLIQRFLGLHFREGHVGFDPVMPQKLDGLEAEVTLLGRRVQVTYRIGGTGCGTVQLLLNDAVLVFERERNPYRLGTAWVRHAAIERFLVDGENRLRVEIG